MRRALWLLLVVGALTTAGEASAYSWMIKHGFSKCSSCHLDPSGGETLTGMGRMESEHLLSLGGQSMSAIWDRSGFAFGALSAPEKLRFGGSYRHFLLYQARDGDTPSSTKTFPMQLDLYGGGAFKRIVFGASFGLARGIEGTAHVRGAQINQERGDGLILLSRNHYVGLRLHEQTILRVGRMNLPFGVRIPEHTLWARESTRTDRESDQQHGVSLTYEHGPLRIEGMFILGNFQLNPDRFRERGASATLEYLLAPTLAVGGSALITRAEEDRLTSIEDAVRYAFGGHARWGVGDLAVLAELDLLRDAERGLGHTGFAQADYEPLRGVHLMLTGELLDQGSPNGGAASPGSGETRFGAWASLLVFPLPHFDVRLDLVQRQQEAMTVQAQVHLYL